jgi:hypothetical protein
MTARRPPAPPPLDGRTFIVAGYIAHELEVAGLDVSPVVDEAGDMTPNLNVRTRLGRVTIRIDLPDDVL